MEIQFHQATSMLGLLSNLVCANDVKPIIWSGYLTLMIVISTIKCVVKISTLRREIQFYQAKSMLGFLSSLPVLSNRLMEGKRESYERQHVLEFNFRSGGNIYRSHNQPTSPLNTFVAMFPCIVVLLMS